MPFSAIRHSTTIFENALNRLQQLTQFAGSQDGVALYGDSLTIKYNHVDSVGGQVCN
jgi:hypothetical protein